MSTQPTIPEGAICHKGPRIGTWTGGRFVAASAGRAHQLRCARFVQARRDLADVVIVGYWGGAR